MSKPDDVLALARSALDGNLPAVPHGMIRLAEEVIRLTALSAPASSENDPDADFLKDIAVGLGSGKTADRLWSIARRLQGPVSQAQGEDERLPLESIDGELAALAADAFPDSYDDALRCMSVLRKARGILQPAAPLASAEGGMPETPAWFEPLRQFDHPAEKEFVKYIDSLRAHALTLQSTNTRLAGEVEQFERLTKKYHELLLGVERKWPNESRHQTALRYIRQAELQRLRREPEGARDDVIEECAKVCEAQCFDGFPTDEHRRGFRSAMTKCLTSIRALASSRERKSDQDAR